MAVQQALAADGAEERAFNGRLAYSESCQSPYEGGALSLTAFWGHKRRLPAMRVQEHLRDSVEGTLRLKRLLSEDSEAGSQKRQNVDKLPAQQRCKIEYLLQKWSLQDDKVMLHVLEGLEMDELEYLDVSAFTPDMFNWQKLPADQAATHVALWHEKVKTLGGGPLDALLTFCERWNLGKDEDSLLRTLSHKDLRYIIDHYDGTQQLEELVQEAQQALPLEGRTEGCMPDAPGVAAISRFHRLELIDPTADAAASRLNQLLNGQPSAKK
ncbi:E3 SUMO-protein ligase RanBP2 [Durusdinium trenchii]|uniref:E3 SUMO-protein ligase RanBP2 n=1 Tax=Durusdinium trenchii TaxID=1381693 RepID=A0ABP0NEY2_9DINO